MTRRQLPDLVKHGRLVVLLVAAACGKAAPTPEPRLFTEDEIAAYEAQLTARLAETAKRTCVRPVVREPGTDTAATPDLIALAEPTGSLATCLKAFVDLSTQPNMTTAKLVESRDPKMVALDATCGDDLAQLVRKAAVHRNACPLTSTLKVCHDGLVALGDAAQTSLRRKSENGSSPTS